MDNFKSIDKALNINSEVVPTPEDVVSKKGQIKKVENNDVGNVEVIKKPPWYNSQLRSSSLGNRPTSFAEMGDPFNSSREVGDVL